MVAHINKVVQVFDKDRVTTLLEDPSDIFNFESRVDNAVFLPKSNFTLDTFEDDLADNPSFIVVAGRFIYPRQTKRIIP